MRWLLTLTKRSWVLSKCLNDDVSHVLNAAVNHTELNLLEEKYQDDTSPLKTGGFVLQMTCMTFLSWKATVTDIMVMAEVQNTTLLNVP